MGISVREYLDDKGDSPYRKWFGRLDPVAAAKATTATYRLQQGNFSNETLTLQTYSEEKRARAHQMWLRTGSDRSKRTLLYVEILVEASTAADGVIWRERRGFGRCRSAMLG
jgi:hypothetical protein